MATVFIDGNQGTTGLRIAQRLSGRKELTLLSLPESERKSLAARVALAKKADVTFLCLPDDASRELVQALPDCEGRIIDASTAHRVDPRFVYGFAELSPEQAKRIAQSNRVAVPGCHAGGCIALLKPLMDADALRADAPLCLSSLTGYSGGGKKMIADYEREDRPECMHAPRPYAVTQSHKHLPEVMHVCGLKQPPIFQPIVIDYYSGMLVSLPLNTDMLKKPLGLSELSGLYKSFYVNQPLIRVLDENPEPSIDSVKRFGDDGMELFATGNDERMILYARFDNLGKGASGSAIECMNLMLGLPPTQGLVCFGDD